MASHRSRGDVSRASSSDPSDRSQPGPSMPSRSMSADPSESTALLQTALPDVAVHEGPCSHGTFSPRVPSPVSSSLLGRDNAQSSSTNGPIDSVVNTLSGNRDWRRKLAKKMKTRSAHTSQALAEQAGFDANARMYMSYYLPFLNWMPQYKWSYLKGDFTASLTVASVYLPMVLSFAENLAHVPPINGLYAFAINPLIYGLLGSCPRMLVGSEAAGSLLVGSVVKSNLRSGPDDDDDMLQARICGVVTGLAGATILIAGIARLGFLDSVLSRPFLRGFISAIGFVIFVDQLIPELGLARYAGDAGVKHGSTAEKLNFLVRHLGRVHKLTFAVAAVSFVVMMVLRQVKIRMQPRYPGVAYIPDRFLVVLVSIILSWQLDWESQGLDVLGEVRAASGHLFTFRWPFQPSQFHLIREAMPTSFLIALLGFFESSIAAKSLGPSDHIQMQLSPNRELVALGVANLVGGCFMSLPAFGGYAKSKLNRQTGGKSPMSAIFLSGFAFSVIFFFLPYLYYLPKPVLSSMISVVAWSLLEEAPHDIAFFLKIRGWSELGLMVTIFVATIFYSLTLGMAIGVGLSVLQVIRHSTRPRIQILGRIPGTHRFENAEANPDRLEFFEGCLIVKIPEPLTFANTGQLKNRLRRLEFYGTNEAHPALPRIRHEESNRNVIFDIHGVTSLDGSGAQVLKEIVANYRERGVRVYFSRGPADERHQVWKIMRRSGIMDLVGGPSHFVADVQEALKMTEYEHSITNARFG
ncbi:sulfate transporter 4.1 [Sodiomyces alkalinus F11]|uniref:Sulfate transporter 4.1 n=1 Tax=Sodiomyces alkalinus (strain CBS 110278 / VKM F-3762 / F11) TaxID=1314773 RepID=A0A3N2PNK9_SODAK|nr:sulfate transporter 4.1 [Sodiomyces alkalinus F11]ROT36108.1 sulfate transporter 4.1 [Sodiomyces alkalinus F11]